MNWENSKTSEKYWLVLNLREKMILKIDYNALSNLNIYYNTLSNLTIYYKIWIAQWIIFCLNYSRLLWVYPIKNRKILRSTLSLVK